MKILLIGSGGRECAIAWKLAQSKKVDEILISPGNGGTTLIDKCRNVEGKDNQQWLSIAKKNKIDLTIVGPEVPLVNGIVDLFSKHNLKIFGPNKVGALLEGSKKYSKEFMIKHNIATAKYQSFSNINKALKYVQEQKYPLVIKADGLASGKGVIIANDVKDAEIAIKNIMGKKVFGKSGNNIIIEEYLTGKEASIICITDSKTIIPLISSQDHKKIGEHETGLNTGGMGAVCPNKHVTTKVMNDFKENIMKPTLLGIQKENINFVGFIFFGVMITKNGCKCLEYNVRLGDPETQSILPLLKTDLLDLFLSAINKSLHQLKIQWFNKSCVNVVLASSGYPEKFEVGYEITLPKDNTLIFQAGTKIIGNKIYTSGGRVLSVVAIGNTLAEAIKNVYKDITKVKFSNMYFRKDIGKN